MYDSRENVALLHDRTEDASRFRHVRFGGAYATETVSFVRGGWVVVCGISFTKDALF